MSVFLHVHQECMEILLLENVIIAFLDAKNVQLITLVINASLLISKRMVPYNVFVLTTLTNMNLNVYNIAQ